jgi:ABC-type multidrug transport system ATPase subunit
VLELKDIRFAIQKGNDEVALLDQIDLRVPTGHFMAIVGPSGCGKSTLLKLIAGINQETSGSIFWNGRNLSEEGDLEASEIGYVPQFSIAYEALTVEENIGSAVRLRAATESRQAFHDLVDQVLASTGLAALRDRPVKVLSGGQRRRLSLALELVTDPVLLLCDEVTSGLDPKSEHEIVELMHQLSRNEHRIVVNVTHSLANLDLYDSVLVLDAGRIVYHGPPRALEHYFSVDKGGRRLSSVSPNAKTGEWADELGRNIISAYYESLPETQTVKHSDSLRIGSHAGSYLRSFLRSFSAAGNSSSGTRDKFSCNSRSSSSSRFLVIVFELDGRRADSAVSLRPSLTTLAEYEQERGDVTFNLNLGGIVSGLVMFQVILLTLMGSNNSAREIAGERYHL